MNNITLSITDAKNNIKMAKSDEDEVAFTYRGEYQAGDSITVGVDTVPCYLMIRLEDSMAPCLIYLCNTQMRFEIPFGDDARAYNSKSFQGGRHFIWARVARAYEIHAYGDLSTNPYSQLGQEGVYPSVHSSIAHSNIRFACRNAIDGYFDSSEHGSYPFTSWSNNQQEQAELVVAFGRNVEIDGCILYLRADFPHDSWWQDVTLLFDGGQAEKLTLQRTGKPQYYALTPRLCQQVTLTNLHKGDEPAPFTALTQIILLGRNVINSQ